MIFYTSFVELNWCLLQDGETALIVAANKGDKDAVEMLLDHGANINAHTKVSKRLSRY